MTRINKYIAESGLCSRRKAEELITNKKVKLNGKIVESLSTKVDDFDIVEVDGEMIKKENRKIYIMLNKPRGYITTSKEQFGRKCVLDLINCEERIFSIGRLDMDTEGLLLLTNDGEFANNIIHPKNEIIKVYIVIYLGIVSDVQIERLRRGVDIGGYITKPADVEKCGKNKLRISIKEGKNRQVRKMCNAVGINLSFLKRIQVGSIKLGNLKIGEYRMLNDSEIKNIIK